MGLFNYLYIPIYELIVMSISPSYHRPLTLRHACTFVSYYTNYFNFIVIVFTLLMSVHALINYINEFKLGLQILAIFHSLFGISCCPFIIRTSTICLDPVIIFDHYIYRSFTLKVLINGKACYTTTLQENLAVIQVLISVYIIRYDNYVRLNCSLSCNTSYALHFHSLLSSHDITRGIETP